MNNDMDLARCYSVTMQVAKVLLCLILFALVWGGAVISKATVMFAASNVRSSDSTSSMGDGASSLECANYSTSDLRPRLQLVYFNDSTSWPDIDTTVLRDEPTLGPPIPVSSTQCLALPRKWNLSKTHEDTCLSPADGLVTSVTYHADMCDTVAMQWVWCLFLIMTTPYLLVFLRCLWIVTFRKKESPNWQVVVFVSIFYWFS